MYITSQEHAHGCVSHLPEGTVPEIGGENRELTSHPQLLSKPRKSDLDPASEERFPRRAGTRNQGSGRWQQGQWRST